MQDGIGIDEYYWSIARQDDPTITLTNFYTSADKSSITVQIPAVLEGLWEIKCAYGRANPWDGNSIPFASHTTVVSKTVGALPSVPTWSAAPPTCMPTGTSSFSITANPGSVDSDFTYTWTIQGASWNLVQPSDASPDVTVNGIDNNPAILTLTIEGDCDPTIVTYNINRNFTSAIAITGATCVTAGSSNVYSLPVNAQINNTTWTLPSGWSINPIGSNTPRSIANISIPSGTPAGSYTITARSTECPSTAVSLVVNVRPATPTFVTTSGQSPTCVTRNGGPAVTYTVNPVAGATSYQWTFPTGWTPSTQTTTSPTISVTPGGTTASGVVSVVAIGAGGCNSTAATRIVNYTGVTPNSISASCWSIGVTGQTVITVANAPSPFYGTYTVTSSPAGLFSNYTVNATTGAITLNTTATATPGTYNLTITHVTGGTCPAAVATLPITVTGNSAVFNNPTITGGSFDPSPGGCDTYTVINATAGSTYQWFLNGSSTPVVANGTTVFFSPSGNALTLCGSGTAPTSVCVVVTNGSCRTRLCAPLVGTHSAARQGNPDNQQNVIKGVSIYPNPSNGDFVINIAAFADSASATISDATGKFIENYKLEQGENKIDRTELSEGTYIVTLIIDGKKESRQIIIK
ncbi:T9SS type A sorting domain-containing protein [Flavobacterium rhizosphaerae]|uniref:T9SS type A sorting domain-containing protein n=1 Tax=Flavobacterium rhizosphaerae TaxID=3163298 RepID=A0ABW8YYN5_9FLAO